MAARGFGRGHRRQGILFVVFPTMTASAAREAGEQPGSSQGGSEATRDQCWSHAAGGAGVHNGDSALTPWQTCHAMEDTVWKMDVRETNDHGCRVCVAWDFLYTGVWHMEQSDMPVRQDWGAKE